MGVEASRLLIGYSVFDIGEECYEYNENACFIASTVEGAKVHPTAHGRRCPESLKQRATLLRISELGTQKHQRTPQRPDLRRHSPVYATYRAIGPRPG